MTAPPSPPYPKNCGKSWDKTKTVTGEIYGKGGFGKDFMKSLSPLGFVAELKDIGRDRQRQQLVEDKIDTFIQRLRREVSNASGAQGQRRILNVDEQKALDWLLTHAQFQLDEVTRIWDKWIFRKVTAGTAGVADGGTFPLDLEDRVTNIPGGGVHCAGRMGKWIDSSDPRGGRIFCPTEAELKQRPKDRAAIEQYFVWAFESTRCAQVGLARMLLYKKAVAAWSGIDLPDIKLPTEPPDQPAQPGELEPLVLDIGDVDMCKLFGIGCDPWDVGPVEPDIPPCPHDWCLDPDGLPPPDQPDLGSGPTLPDRPSEPKGTKRAMSDATAGLLTVGAAGLLFAAYKFLAPR